MDTRTERIRALNDRLRTTGEGGNVVITRGLAALDAEILRKIMAVIQCFDSSLPTTTRTASTTVPSLTLPVSA
jgi:hypothetical protein